jgi:hypothetical protein
VKISQLKTQIHYLYPIIKHEKQTRKLCYHRYLLVFLVYSTHRFSLEDTCLSISLDKVTKNNTSFCTLKYCLCDSHTPLSILKESLGLMFLKI